MFEQEYKDVFSKVAPPEKLLSDILAGKPAKKHPRFSVAYAVVLCALVCFLAACSAVLFDAGSMLEAAFGENGRAEYGEDELMYVKPVGKIDGRFVFEGSRYALDPKISEKYLIPHIFEINQSITDGKTTLYVNAGLYDPVSCAGILYMTLEDPEGFPDVHIWSNGQISWLNENNEERYYLDTTAMNLFYVVEEEREDTRMGMICTFAHLRDEESIDVFYRETQESITIQLPVDQTMESISFADGDVILTPISLTLDAEILNRMNLTMKPILTVQLQDGTEKTILWHDQYKKKTVFDRTQIRAPVRNYYLMTGYPVDDPDVNPGYLLTFVADIQNVKSITINDEILLPD